MTIIIPDSVGKFFQVALFSWKTSCLGLLSIAYGVFQAFAAQDTTLTMAIHDPKLQMALIVAVMGFVSKDATSHGTPANPITPEAAAKLAVVAAEAPAPASKS